MDTPPSHLLRSDARDNRDRVLEAARELFARSGLAVTMREIARHAGVGPATLYRRFPTKEALTLEAFLDELHACRRIVRDAADDPDPWRGFCSVVERITVLNAQNQGFTDAFLSAFPTAVDFPAHRAQMLRAMSGLARRAKTAGRLRQDFVIDDFVLVLLAGRGIATAQREDRTAAARRYAALAIDGFRAADSNGALPRGAHLAAAVVAKA
jgi:AcrR family transcriptional regulator